MAKGNGEKVKAILARKNSADAIDKEKAIQAAIERINKQHGSGSSMRLGDNTGIVVDPLPTGVYTLDHYALGVGGFPRGRVVEIFGPESSGKTTLALATIAEAQQAGGHAAFIDVEHALDPAWAETNGVDIRSLVVSQPDFGEQALDIADSYINSGAFDVVVVDSVAALTPKAEIEGEYGDSFMGVQARMMSQALRKLTGACSRTKTVLIFINQIREKIGVMFGSPETTTGGRALKFYASVRLDVRRIATEKTDEVATSNRVKIKVLKNKVAPPFRETEVDLRYDSGIDKVGSLLDAAVDAEVVEKSGSWYSFQQERLGQGREASLALLKQSPEVLEKIKEKLEAINGDVIA